jgi:hypothetical protein
VVGERVLTGAEGCWRPGPLLGAQGPRAIEVSARRADEHQILVADLVQKKIGPAWTERGRPPNGYVTKRLAEAWLRDTLDRRREWAVEGSNLRPWD